jgi:hypothetical protein
MRTKLVALVLLCLMTGTATAQEAKVTSLMSKDLAGYPGKEVLPPLGNLLESGDDPLDNAESLLSVGACRHGV